MAAPLEDDEDPVSENFYSLLNVSTDVRLISFFLITGNVKL